MTSYPGAIYSPRTKENKPGVVYDAGQTTKLFAEDVVKDDDEIVAIETELGVNPKGIYDSVADFLQDLLTSVGTIVTTFLGLSDTPSSYTGQGGKAVFVKLDETGLEFDDAASGLTKATGAEINTGTDDDKYVTPKAIADSNIAFLADLPPNQGGLYGFNVETLSAGKTLTPNTDKIYQALNVNGANRIITLATAGATLGDRFYIFNSGTYTAAYYLQIKESSTTIDKIYTASSKLFIFDGTHWIGADNGSGDFGSTIYNTAIGNLSAAYNLGAAFGASALGHTEGAALGVLAWGYSQGAALGRSANGNGEGVAVGYTTQGRTKGIAVGFQASSNDMDYGIALGYNAKNFRKGETTTEMTGSSSQYNNQISVRLTKTTTNNTPIELLCAGLSGQRLLIRPSSVLAFQALIVARDNVAGQGAAYKVEGVIKRDASNNTALIGTPTVTVIQEEDSAWNLTVAADDTNEALVFTATGDASNPTQWACVVTGVETHF